MNGSNRRFRVVRASPGIPTKSTKCEPGFIIAEVKKQYKGHKCVGEKIVGFYYNDGKNNPTRQGKKPFTKGAARRAINQLSR